MRPFGKPLREIRPEPTQRPRSVTATPSKATTGRPQPAAARARAAKPPAAAPVRTGPPPVDPAGRIDAVQAQPSAPSKRERAAREKARRAARLRRLVARAAPHAEAIRAMLAADLEANGDATWSVRVHATIADRLSIPHGAVHAWIAREIGEGRLVNPNAAKGGRP